MYVCIYLSIPLSIIDLANRYADVRTELRNLAAVDTNKAAVR